MLKLPLCFRQVCLFLKRGANQNASDIDEKTPLTIAVDAANADIVTLWVLFFFFVLLLFYLARVVWASKLLNQPAQLSYHRHGTAGVPQEKLGPQMVLHVECWNSNISYGIIYFHYINPYGLKQTYIITSMTQQASFLLAWLTAWITKVQASFKT